MKIIDKRVICSNPDSVFNYFGWPTVARLPDGALALAASGFRMRHICPFGKGIICYSFDEGKSWTSPAAVMDTPLDDRDSGIVAFGDGRDPLCIPSKTNDGFRFFRVSSSEIYGTNASLLTSVTRSLGDR